MVTVAAISSNFSRTSFCSSFQEIAAAYQRRLPRRGLCRTGGLRRARASLTSEELDSLDGRAGKR